MAKVTNRIVLEANQGYVYTNGINYGKVIYLAQGVNSDTYYQITEK